MIVITGKIFQRNAGFCNDLHTRCDRIAVGNVIITATLNGVTDGMPQIQKLSLPFVKFVLANNISFVTDTLCNNILPQKVHAELLEMGKKIRIKQNSIFNNFCAAVPKHIF